MSKKQGKYHGVPKREVAILLGAPLGIVVGALRHLDYKVAFRNKWEFPRFSETYWSMPHTAPLNFRRELFRRWDAAASHQVRSAGQEELREILPLLRPRSASFWEVHETLSIKPAIPEINGHDDEKVRKYFARWMVQGERLDRGFYEDWTKACQSRFSRIEHRDERSLRCLWALLPPESRELRRLIILRATHIIKGHHCHS